jgi:hypothetical protein
MPHPRASVSIGVAFLVVAAAGCGGTLLTSRDPPPTPPPDMAAIAASKASGVPCQPIPTEPGEVVYIGFGVRTYPAPAGTPTTVTVEDVLAGSDVRSWGPGSSPETELRLVTTGDFGCESNPTGVVRQPGWVVTIHGTTPVPGGPPGTPKPDPALKCDSVVIIDARTGALLLNSQACGGEPAVRSTIPG